MTALWGTTATAQTIQPIIKLAPDLVVTTIGLDCTGVRVVVKNTGDAVLRITSPIVVRINALIGIESGAKIFDKALSATSLSSGQTETVNFLLAGAPGFLAVTATADANSSLTESNETNNERRTLDEQTCPLLTVNDASVAEGGTWCSRRRSIDARRGTPHSAGPPRRPVQSGVPPAADWWIS